MEECMNFLTKAFYLVLCFCAISVQGIFYRGERFVHRNGNIIECFGDIHIPCEDPSLVHQQQNDILAYAKDHNAHVIVEDMNARYEQNGFDSMWDVDVSCTMPLDSLSTQCDAIGIDSSNVEFRELSAASLAGFPISAQQTIRSFNNIVNEIYAYNDTHFLNAYYWRTLTNVVNQHKQLINSLESSRCTLKDFCESEDKQIQDQVNLFDVTLLDMRIIHAIYTNRYKSRILVCAGANHIRRIIPVLRKMGYSSEGVIEKEVFMQDYDLIRTSSAIDVQEYVDYIEKNKSYFAKTNNLNQFGMLEKSFSSLCSNCS
jgi:hypothetical protein